jgi:TolB-like protein
MAPWLFAALPEHETLMPRRELSGLNESALVGHPGGTFADVKVYDGRSSADYILSGRLEKLEEVDYEGGVKVEVALSAQMTDVRTGAQVWANAVTEVGRVDQRNVPAVVSEMSNAMDRAINKLLLSFPTSALASNRQR